MFYSASVYFIRVNILILCTSYFSYAGSVTWIDNNFPGNITRYRRQTNYGSGSFQCGSGECKHEERLCDGKEDCQDGSDESDCKDIPCPPRYLFKCNYGACISRQLVCDGKPDCKDNSDETVAGCKPPTNPVTTAPVSSPCGTSKFQCDSGDCIDDRLLCDGKANCADYSDETEKSCSHFKCPRTTHKCRYGACVSKMARCNNVVECFDGSDEESCTNTTKPTKPTPSPPTPPPTTGPILPGSCAMPNNPAHGVYTIGNILPGTIKPGSYVSPYIPLRTLCIRDYKPTPPDRSISRCSDGKWAPDPPKCSRLCSGVNSTKTTKITCIFRGRSLDSCNDPVEETIAIISCELLHEEPSVILYPFRVCRDGTWDRPFPECYPISSPSTPQIQHRLPGSCAMPNNPANGVYTISNNEPGTFKPGSYVSPYSPLRILCNQHYKPNPPDRTVSLCFDGKWLPDPPQCSASCPEVNSTKTTKVICSFKGRQLDTCNDPVEDTVATISCEPFHEEPGLAKNPFRVCRDGSWDRSFPQCYPICGVKRPEGTPNIFNEPVAAKADFPWHAGIYDSHTKNHICGGSILNERVILSVAHCFTDHTTGAIHPKENYLIASGKYYRMYEDPRDVFAQYSTINDIHIPSRYKGDVSQYEADLAVLVLTTKLTLSKTVLPVCVDWQSSFEFQQLSENNAGVVVGWGHTAEGEEPSEVLKELSVSVIPYDRCYEQVPKAFRRFLTHDIVCAEFLGNAACQGDSGVGLTFPDSNDRYYIRGIVSTSPKAANNLCNSNQYATFTLVSKYVDFIKLYGL